jgi:hypothetical protein
MANYTTASASRDGQRGKSAPCWNRTPITEAKAAPISCWVVTELERRHETDEPELVDWSECSSEFAFIASKDHLKRGN